MDVIAPLVVMCNILVCLPSVASYTRMDIWWIRGFDFPRIQISVLIAINLVLALLVYPFDAAHHFILFGAMLFALGYQVHLIYPYTPLSKKQVVQYTGNSGGDMLSILISNVLTPNDQYQKLLAIIRDKCPDVVLTLESDKKWERALAPLERDYGHTVKIPQDNLYGMHLYSKLPLKDVSVRFLVVDDIPSIHAKMELPNGKVATIHCVHPRPPSPSESKTSTNRDAELLLVGKQIPDDPKLTLVFGDLNDVAWSRTTKLFQKISKLMDPRRGRGFFNTYHANHKLMRWPLDHVFHSNDFALVSMSREPYMGSDHFPIYIKLNYTPRVQWQQEVLQANAEEKEWAQKKIRKTDAAGTTIKS
ncbi:endonuclease/exonuclease/phosphatase family protein [Maribacter sp. 2307ULW6-5]|uniref:endonuclease/exonuclease/phosphatase family protein n=1 Tax=Maribacter sp. 2307ULW6-5 TaxID=3386275 RepID=UPI0039BD8563